ncbi:MAG: proton-conducting transporter membrane subunit [Chitinophagaceae bacterium]
MSQLLPLFIFLPLFAFVASLFFVNKKEKQITFIAQTAMALYIAGSIIFAVVWFADGYTPVIYKLVTLYETDGFVFIIQFYYDHITAVYSVVGSLIFFLVASFSKFYMHRDEGFKRFFNTLLFFSLGFNLIIFSGNFETLFIGWEFIGLSSFLLIAFYRNRYLPVKNGFKVLSIYRLSDIALILAMWILHHLTHQNIGFTQLAEAKDIAIQNQHTGMALFITLMFVLAATAKSAQIPFTTWLPRAMEGPTSSSAIFYGSLSVHIGVFILLRTYPFWQEMFGIKLVIIIIGLVTGFVASLIARRQPTVKTQIAYASAAQIGLIFIEVALGLHWLALIHFAGNAFLRTYQLLVSPSVLNYLIHHQYFHYKPGIADGKNKLVNTLYVLAIKEWNLDGFLYKYFWMPFKLIGRQLRFLETKAAQVIVAGLVIAAAFLMGRSKSIIELPANVIPVLFVGIAFVLILFSFSSRKSAITAWLYLLPAHAFIICCIWYNAAHVDSLQLLMYGSGVLLAAFIGFACLQKIYSIDKDISLNKFHGYVYEQKGTALLFLLSAIGLLGFPITAAFIGIDVFFTHIESGQYALITLTGLCFLFIELAAIRIYCRVFLGLHKKLNHAVAFRSS